jgi:hypothetical protein
MGHGLQVHQRSLACDGHSVLVGGAASPPGDRDAPELGLASLLGEAEAAGLRPTTVTLRLTRREDLTWARPALRWLHAHGRRVLLRSAIALPRGFADEALAHGLTLVLELAHHRPELQRALLGPSADSAATLLLHAQHLAWRGVGVGVHLGPLIAGLHDQPAQLTPLLHHIRAADLWQVHLSVGRLTSARAEALRQALDPGLALAIRRTYGDREQLPRLAHTALHDGTGRLVRERGLRIDACGCPSFCQLDSGARPPYVPVLASDLFVAL